MSFSLRCTATAILLFALSGCMESSHPQPTESCRYNAQTYLEGGTLFTQQSAEYRALCYQAYAMASWRLQLLAPEAERPAVVLDLDETVLDNSPYTAWQVANDQPFSPDTWTLWVERAEALAVPGAREFLRFADSLGIALFYISNRDTAHLQATIANMQTLGLPQLSPEHFMLKTTTSDKTERRKAVEDLGHKVVLFVGDNLGDFEGTYDKPTDNLSRKRMADEQRSAFGNKYIVLPNALYGTWEGALYGYNRDLSDTERCRLRSEALEAAVIQ